MGFGIGGALHGAANWIGREVEHVAAENGEPVGDARSFVGERLDDVGRAKEWVGGRIDGLVEGLREHSADSAGSEAAAGPGDWSRFVGHGVVDIGHLLAGAGKAASEVARNARGDEAAGIPSDDLAAILCRADTGRTVHGKKLLKFESFDDLNTAANAALPNAIYEYGSLRWTTDAQGRVARAEGQVLLDAVGRNDPALQRRIGNEGYATDVGFHLIADSFGGPTNRLNVVPGNGKPLPDGTKNLNTGAYATFERQIRQIKQAHPDLKIQMRVEALYDAGNTTSRPDAFIASYRAEGGKWIEYEFDNIH